MSTVFGQGTTNHERCDRRRLRRRNDKEVRRRNFTSFTTPFALFGHGLGTIVVVVVFVSLILFFFVWNLFYVYQSIENVLTHTNSSPGHNTLFYKHFLKSSAWKSRSSHNSESNLKYYNSLQEKLRPNNGERAPYSLEGMFQSSDNNNRRSDRYYYYDHPGSQKTQEQQDPLERGIYHHDLKYTLSTKDINNSKIDTMTKWFGKRNGIDVLVKDSQIATKKKRRTMKYHKIWFANTTLRSMFETEHDPNDLDTMYQALSNATKRIAPQVIAQEHHRSNPSSPIDNDKSLESEIGYDIYNCPLDAPPQKKRKNRQGDNGEMSETINDEDYYSYPFTWNAVRTVLKNWNPDNVSIPTTIFQSLCVFDWRNKSHQRAAYLYQRKYEVPFVVRYHPDVIRTSYRWWAFDENNQQKRHSNFNVNPTSQTSHELNHQTLPYLDRLLQSIGPQRTEHSRTNHFMYWNSRVVSGYHKKNDVSLAGGQNNRVNRVYDQFHRSRTRHKPSTWEPPTENIELTYSEWKQKYLESVKSSTRNLEKKDANITGDDWYYFRLNAMYPLESSFDRSEGCCHEFLFDELPFFDPTITTATNNNDFDKKDNRDENNNQTFTSSSDIFLVDPAAERGINCRFGTSGSIAEAHFDPSRNFVVVLGGLRRYILAHPSQCQYLELYPFDHPSGRHSKVDWSTIAMDISPENYTNQQQEESKRPFFKASVTEVLLQAGDALYLPTSWFHFIVSLTTPTYQCNARSGVTTENHHHIRQCGFPI